MPRGYTLTPLSIFSREFAATPDDGQGGSYRVLINSLGEQGSITTPQGVRSDVIKHGLGSGRWTLNEGSRVLADAQKFSPFTRTFTILTGSESFQLRADHPFTRRFTLWRSELAVLTVEPTSVFSRKASVTSADEVDSRVALFCFWIAALMWRRAARSN